MTDKTLLPDIVATAVAETLTPEYVQNAIQKRVAELVADAVNEALRGYSDNGKLIRDAVKNSLRVASLDLPAYGHLVSDMLQRKIEASVSELIAGQLAQDMDKMLRLAPKEVKLSEIAEGLMQPFKDDGNYGHEITVIVEETEYGSTWVTLDDEKWSNTSSHPPKAEILLSSEGTIFSATVRDFPYTASFGDKHKGSNRFGAFADLEGKLRAYHACGTKIILDEDDVVTYLDYD